MIDVNLNTSMFKNLMFQLFGLKMAINSINNQILNEQKNNLNRLKEINNSKVNFDMRYKDTKDFFNSPLESKSVPRIKQTKLNELDDNMILIYKHRERINSYNSNVSSIKHTALYKQLRSTIWV